MHGKTWEANALVSAASFGWFSHAKQPISTAIALLFGRVRLARLGNEDTGDLDIRGGQ